MDLFGKVKLVGTREVYGETLAMLGEKNNDIVVLDADLSSSTKTNLFAKKFPDRFFNMGIAEQDMMGTAAGLALGGKIPFVSTFAIFASGRAWEQIRYSIAYNSLPVKIVASHGGITVGEDGGSHQSTEDIALMRVLPHMTVIVPCDGIEIKKALECLVEYRGPCYLRVSRIKTPLIFDDEYEFQIGKGTILKEGTDLTIIGTGIMVFFALKAAQSLLDEGISTRVLNISTIKPIDEEIIIDSARKTGAIVTVEEHSIIGGLGSAVAEVISEHCPCLLKRVGIKDKFGTSGRYEELLTHYGLTSEEIVYQSKEALRGKDIQNRRRRD